jgi:hypothetical protein
MGIVRKALHVTTVGVVAPNSRKQRVATQTLVAIQGGTPSQVRRAGGRYEHGPAAAVDNARVARERAAQAPAQPATTRSAYNRADAIAETADLLARVRKNRVKSAAGLAKWRLEHPDVP